MAASAYLVVASLSISFGASARWGVDPEYISRESFAFANVGYSIALILCFMAGIVWRFPEEAGTSLRSFPVLANTLEFIVDHKNELPLRISFAFVGTIFFLLLWFWVPGLLKIFS